MDLCLTGRMMSAAEAERSGLVARVVPLERLLPEALEAAATIAGHSLPVAMMIKECINQSFAGLDAGLLFERRVFHASFALEDRQEGMTAFLEKRPPNFRHR
jgi:enoyl-CoA hydratase